MVGALRMWLYRAHPGNPRQMRRRRPISSTNRTPLPNRPRLHPVYGHRCVVCDRRSRLERLASEAGVDPDELRASLREQVALVERANLYVATTQRERSD